MVKRVTPAELAQRFHETYERLAPDFGYRTREASAKPWEQVPENNRALMIATCAEVLHFLDLGTECRECLDGSNTYPHGEHCEQTHTPWKNCGEDCCTTEPWGINAPSEGKQA